MASPAGWRVPGGAQLTFLGFFAGGRLALVRRAALFCLFLVFATLFRFSSFVGFGAVFLPRRRAFVRARFFALPALVGFFALEFFFALELLLALAVVLVFFRLLVVFARDGRRLLQP